MKGTIFSSSYNYESSFDSNEWKNNNIISLDDNIPVNDDYENENILKKRYFIRNNNINRNKSKHK